MTLTLMISPFSFQLKMVKSSHKKLLFGICECRPHLPYRGRQLQKHISDKQHKAHEFLFCPDHLTILEKDSTNEQKEEFYTTHQHCNTSKTNSPKIKEFFAARQTHNYIQHRQMTITLEDVQEDEEDDDEEDEEEEGTTHTTAGWEELLLGDLTPKESETQTAVTNLIASEQTLPQEDTNTTPEITPTEPILIPGHQMKSLSTHALKDSLNKQKAINKELKTQIEQLKQQEQAVLFKAEENDTTEKLLKSTQAVLSAVEERQAEKEKKLDEKEKELDEKQKKIDESLKQLEEKQQKTTQATEALNKREEQFQKAQTIFNKKYTEFKTQQAQVNAPTTYKIHIPMNGKIVGDPITHTNTCFSDITCGHINITIEDTNIKTITWRNQQNAKRHLTHEHEINSDEEKEHPTAKRPRMN